MRMNNDKPRVTVSIGRVLPINEIASQLRLDSFQVKSELESAIREHYFHFASKPVSLEYSPSQGYTLRAMSAVGLLVTPSFILEIAPKIPQLSIGKALGLAQESGISLLNINSKSLAKNALSERSSYSSVDFLGFSLVDAVLTIRNNGFARKFEEVIEPAARLRGDVAFQETISSGLTSLRPATQDIEPSLDIYPNQVLKCALALCARNSSSYELQKLAQLLIDSLAGVESISPEQVLIDEIFASFSIPRPDYDMALAFAKALLEGRLISSSESNLFTPAFTLDMDKVFESYCTTQISNLIVRERYNVLAQQQFDHSMVPNVAEKKIIPDVVIEQKATGERIILDLKNKYSQLRDEGEFKISNDDLYQLAYYAKTLKAKCCFVVFPGANPSVQYPLKSSGNPESYEQRRARKLQEIKERNSIVIFQDEPITIYSYSINLLGSLQDTRKSVAGLCQLLIDI